MEAKEEAKELVKRFFTIIGGQLDENPKVYLNTKIWNEAKQCALLCVDKLLINNFWEELESKENYIKYWLEVKKEIQLL